MRPEDVRPGTGNNVIDSSGRNPLSFGEKCALEMQRRNRGSEGMAPGMVEEKNLRDISTTSGGIKTPKHLTWSRSITVR